MQPGQLFLANLEMQIFKNFLTPHGQPLALLVKLYWVLDSRELIEISWLLWLSIDICPIQDVPKHISQHFLKTLQLVSEGFKSKLTRFQNSFLSCYELLIDNSYVLVLLHYLILLEMICINHFFNWNILLSNRK